LENIPFIFYKPSAFNR